MEAECWGICSCCLYFYAYFELFSQKRWLEESDTCTDATSVTKTSGRGVWGAVGFRWLSRAGFCSQRVLGYKNRKQPKPMSHNRWTLPEASCSPSPGNRQDTHLQLCFPRFSMAEGRCHPPASSMHLTQPHGVPAALSTERAGRGACELGSPLPTPWSGRQEGWEGGWAGVRGLGCLSLQLKLLLGERVAACSLKRHT